MRYLTAVLAPIIVIGGLTVGVLWYYGGFDSPPPVASTSPPPPQNGPCPDDPGVRQAVTPNYLTATSDPYAGPGPHPVSVMPVDRTKPGAYWDATSLRSEWEVAAYHDDQRPQLVLCQYATRLDMAGQVCEYDTQWTPNVPRVPERPWPGSPHTSQRPPDHRLTAYHARYAYRLYALQTGELLTEMDVNGVHCPALIDIDRERKPTSVLFAPDRAQVEAMVAPFVEVAR